MIAYVKGVLVHVSAVNIVIDVHGIGYTIFIPMGLSAKLPQLQSEILLHTTFVIREFSQALYGFLSIEDKDVFEVLMEVSGVGPKLALSIIGHLSLDELHASIRQRNLTSLCKVPGIGKKTAERLCIELRDKLPMPIASASGNLSTPLPTHPFDQKISDAMRALINLGYNQLTAQKAIKQSLKDLPEEVDIALLITTALKNVK